MTGLNNYKYIWCNNKFSKFKFFFNNIGETDFYFNEFLYFNEFNLTSLNDSNNFEKNLEFLVDFKLNSGFLKKDFNISAVLLDKLGKTKFNDVLFSNEDDFFFNKYINNDIILESHNLTTNFNEYVGSTKLKNYLTIDNSKQPIYNFFNSEFFLMTDDFNGANFLQDFKNNDKTKFYYEDLKNNFYNDELYDLKQFDFKSIKSAFFKNNRSILSFFLKKKIKNKRKFNKVIKNLIKKSFYNFILYFEFSLSSVCLRSQLFFNENDINFFLKNRYILINNKITHNANFSLNINDRINIIFDKYYYYYYRNVVNNINYNLIKLGNYNFLLEQKRYDFNKQVKSHTPK